MRAFFSRKNIVILLSGVALAGLASFGLLYRSHLAVKDSAGKQRIVVTDQGTQRLLVLDPAETDWNSDSAVKWSWRPTAGNGFSDNDAVNGWRLPSEVRLRNSKFFGGQVLLVCDSGGLLAVIPYPGGNTRLWSQNIGRAADNANNPHAMELLPDGNVAVAASNGGWVRIYTSSQGADASNYVQYDLKQAHGVLWDPEKKLLWVLGDDYLTALKVSGTASAPVVAEDTSLRLKLPTPHGHDLQPVYGNTDRLWVTTGLRVYQYVKSTKSWDMNYPGANIKGGTDINREAVKSVGNDPSGKTVLETKAFNVVYSWCTDTVDFIRPDGDPAHEARVRSNMAIYKARYMNPDYQ